MLIFLRYLEISEIWIPQYQNDSYKLQGIQQSARDKDKKDKKDKKDTASNVS